MATETLYNFHDELALEIRKYHGPGIWRPRNRRSIMRKPSATTRRRATRISSSSSWAKEALDVLDAESELFNSSTQYTTANGNVVVGAYRLYALTGMLLPELGIKEDPLYESPRNSRKSARFLR